MKVLSSIVVVCFALALCNLTGKRANQNNNANSASSGSMTENANSNANTEAPPPPIRNNNAQKPGVAQTVPPSSSMPGANHNTAASVPRAPISGGVLNGKATSLPKPAYPAIARAAHASGTVNVRVLVDENGNVISAVPVSGHPLLQASAVAAARQAKFSPTMLSGQPVKVSGVIVYNFVAQ